MEKSTFSLAIKIRFRFNVIRSVQDTCCPIVSLETIITMASIKMTQMDHFTVSFVSIWGPIVTNETPKSVWNTLIVSHATDNS